MVKELKGGAGNFGFDWEVKCVRKGFEDYRVIRDKSENLPAVSLLADRKELLPVDIKSSPADSKPADSKSKNDSDKSVKDLSKKQ